MTPATQPCFGRPRLKRLMLAATSMMALGVAGCVPHHAVKSTGNEKPLAMATPPAPAAPRTLSFSAIFDELQHGHYSNGAQDLRLYLAQHPGDRPAKNLLHQLVADPEQTLGAASRSYVVHAGDSYSTLAARYLGNSGAFVILARYNGSDNPSMLRVGETIRLPLFNPGAAAGDVSPTAKAQRLQRESTALLDQGHNNAALAHLGQALAIEPGLKPAGLQAAALREQLLASYDQRALALYRRQQLNQAIALWDRVLAIDPKYAPAISHRARALEQQRLAKRP